MTTRAPRAVSKGLFTPPQLTLLSIGLVCCFAVTSLAFGQETGEVVVPEHWSRYQAPTSYPEGTQIHIIVRGDTLWDLAGVYLENPFLWPQLWDANRYIENPHLIYPGDPVRIPDVDMVRPEGVPADTEPGEGGGPGGPGAEGGPGGPPGSAQGLPGAGAGGPAFYPAFEEQTIACAGYLSEDEDESFRVVGAEEGDAKVGFATGDIIYLNRGSNDGVSAGDRFYVQRQVDIGWGLDGKRVERTGGVVVLAVQEDTAMGEVVASCIDMNIGDYLIPYEPIPVPLLPKQPPPNRLTPETGQMRGEIAASLDSLASLGEGYLVSIDLGERDGVVPGNIFTVFRYVVPGAPRKVLGELAILTVQNSHSTARIMESYDFMVVGDLVELK